MASTTRNLVRTAVLAAGIWLGATSAALAQSWIGPVVARGEDPDNNCLVEVSGNGRFYRLDAYGLEPGQSMQLVIYNENMRPIQRTVRSSSGGTWSDFYMPALPLRDSGLAQADLFGAGCELSVQFAWHRPTGTPASGPAWAQTLLPTD